MRAHSLSAFLLAVALSSCCTTSSSSERATARSEVEARMATLVRLAEARDGRAQVALHADDALLLPPGSDPVEGRAAIEAFLTAPSSGTIADTEIETLRLDVDGDHAYHVGTYAYALTEDGETERFRGRFVMVWRREADGWKVLVDLWDRE